MKRIFALLLALVMLMPLCALGEEAATPETVTPSRILKYGCRGEDVELLQKVLNTLGYYNSKMDSYFGGDLKRAVETFQKANGLKVDGKVGQQTLEKLLSGDVITYAEYSKTFTLQWGSHGENVKDLQRALRETYFYTGKIDGIFGSEVNTAVKNFQTACRLTVDGKVGKATRTALYDRTGYVFTGAPVRTLRQGSRGWDVYVLQQKLASLNYLSKYTAGSFTSEVADAVKAFQKVNGLEETGIYNSTLKRYLYPAVTDREEREDQEQQGTEDDPYIPRTLKLKKSGQDVANLQMRLKAGGYLLGKADGIFGTATEAAVKRLQKDVGLKEDGIVGPKTWQAVLRLNVKNADAEITDPEKPAPAVGSGIRKLQRYCKGADVTKLQNQLIDLGFLPQGEADGVFGIKTKQAVIDFQKSVGIGADGVVGTKTFTKLNEALGIQWLLYGEEVR